MEGARENPEGERSMPIFVPVDDYLVGEAQQLGRHKTRKAAVTEALREYIQRHRQALEMEVHGSFPHEAAFDCQP